MKSAAIIFCILSLHSCSNESERNAVKEDKLVAQRIDSNQTFVVEKLPETTVVKESDELILFEEKEYRQIKPELKEISEAKYKLLVKSGSEKSCKNLTEFLKSCGLKILNDCDEICDTYLIEKSTGKKLLLPSGYDQGIIGMDFSKSCSKFLIYSSYDGPDYTNYYEERSEILGYNFSGKSGLKDIKPSFQIYFKDWSVSEVFWIDNKTIALKLYTEENGKVADHYFRAGIK